MTDGQLMSPPEDRTAPAPQRRTDYRERLREIIHQEVSKLNPTDDARRALELIIESSVRTSDDNGEMRITVTDEHGQPRMIERDGRSVAFTLDDLVEELRARHPVLFKPGPKREEPDDETRTVEVPRQIPVSHDRDWLKVAEASKPVPDVPFVQEKSLFSLDRASDLAEGMRERLSFRPSHIAAGLLVLALLGGGALALLGRDEPVSQARSGEPEATGAVPTNQTRTAAAPSPSSAGTPLSGVPDVIDTATLSLNGEVVRLFGVEWAPGGGKPEDLTRYLQGREVNCEPAGAAETYRCRVGEQDLSRVVLFNGGGKPTAEATPELKGAAEKAREGKLGVWSPTATQ
jgi:endonuclease YncB( thermonuclease family)